MRTLKQITLLTTVALFSGFSSGCALAGDDLTRNEFCGMLVDYGDDSCKFLREINLNSAIRREELNNVTKSASSVVDLSIKRWIGENNKKFSNKKINLYHKGRSLTSKDYGVDGVINVFFWMVEIENKNMIDVIFFSKSKYSHIVTSRQCELGGSLNDCLNKTVYELLEKNVSSQVFNNDANPI